MTPVMGAPAPAAAQATAPINPVPPAQRLIVTTDLLERKRQMLEISDAFLALPGGYGTLDEIIEVVATSYLGQHAKPLILLDVDGIWSGLLTLFQELHRHDYAHPGPGQLLSLVATPRQAMRLLAEHQATAALPSCPQMTGS